MLTPGSINYRLLELIETLGLTKNQFANRIGISSALVSKITTREINFGVEILEKIVNAFPEINLKWLLIGSGGIFERLEEGVDDPSEKEFSKDFFIDFRINVLEPLQEEVIALLELNDQIKGRKVTATAYNDINEVFKPIYKKLNAFLAKAATPIDQKLAKQVYNELLAHARKYQNKRRELFLELRFQISNGIMSKTIRIEKLDMRS